MRLRPSPWVTDCCSSPPATRATAGHRPRGSRPTRRYAAVVEAARILGEVAVDAVDPL